MAYIRHEITLEDIKAENPEQIWYSVNTCWWTHRRTDLRQKFNSGLPCDPRGGVLRMMAARAFIAYAEANPDHYGRHQLDALMAAHNDNCVVSEGDPTKTCLESWGEYNDLLEEQAFRDINGATWQETGIPIPESGKLQLSIKPEMSEAAKALVSEPSFAAGIYKMIHRDEFIQQAIDVLNEALAIDPYAINALMKLEVVCHAGLGRHPTIQVGAQQHRLTLRPLGLINGLFGADEDGWGFICMKTDEDGRIVEFALTPPRDDSVEARDAEAAQEAAARAYENAEAESHYRQIAAEEQDTDDF